MLKWETYNTHWDWKETLLQSSKSRFRRSGSDLSVKTCSDCQLKFLSQIDHADVLDLQHALKKETLFWVLKWTSWAQWYIAIAETKRQLLYRNWRTYGKSKKQSSFRRSNYRHQKNGMLKWETYNMLWDWKKTLLQSSKSRFRRSGSDMSVKTCSECQLKIAVPNRSRRRFRA